jgi:hypothetical protein
MTVKQSWRTRLEKIAQARAPVPQLQFVWLRPGETEASANGMVAGGQGSEGEPSDPLLRHPQEKAS